MSRPTISSSSSGDLASGEMSSGAFPLGIVDSGMAPPRIVSEDQGPGGTRTPVATIETSQESTPADHRDLTAALISTIVHLVVLLLLALWVIPSVVGPPSISIESAFAQSPMVAIETLELEPIDLPEVSELEEQPAEVIEPVAAVPLEIQIDSLRAGDELESMQAAEPVAELIAPLSPVESRSIEGAVDSVTGAIESKLEKGDVLVVWLLDASGSLVDDRKRVAERLTPFYERIAEERAGANHKLESAVVSFGARMNERIPPTEFGRRIINAVESLPIDRSGDERVFDAVARCADHYRDYDSRAQLVIAVWTDETGDDTAYLENTIKVCTRNRAAVYVVGPSSVLGADTGLHSYTDPKTSSVYQLPVKRGPDSAMPERIELGYWYITQMNGMRFAGGRFGRGLPPWIGGQDLQGILCGFSPYALTRLANQTGGSYTIFDRPEDRSPFEYETMVNYAPRYESLDAYQDQLRSSPLRRAIMDAVEELQGKNLDAPETKFFIKKTGDRVFDYMRFYYPAREFQAKLRSSRVRLTRQASTTARLVEKALAHLSHEDDPESGMDGLYSSETSPRWRAWYDLTRGRLLATSVRLEEYRLTIEAISKSGALSPSTNYITLSASPNRRSEGKFIERAEEAERLLRRCVAEHAGTPWEVLAQRELDFALGVGVREQALTPTRGGAPMGRQPNLPKF